uniref:Uncharacterized protein n=1 Tax=Schistocephalus solidus TaxID=70667 RepID=A0A0X3PTX6_SCHSO
MFVSVLFLRRSYIVSLITILIAGLLALFYLMPYDSENNNMSTFRALFGAAVSLNIISILCSAVAFKKELLKWLDVISCICYLIMLILYTVGAGFFYGSILHHVPTSVTWAIVSASMSLVLIPPIIGRVLVLAK